MQHGLDLRVGTAPPEATEPGLIAEELVPDESMVSLLPDGEGEPVAVVTARTIIDFAKEYGSKSAGPLIRGLTVGAAQNPEIRSMMYLNGEDPYRPEQDATGIRVDSIRQLERLVTSGELSVKYIQSGSRELLRALAERLFVYREIPMELASPDGDMHGELPDTPVDR